MNKTKIRIGSPRYGFYFFADIDKSTDYLYNYELQGVVIMSINNENAVRIKREFESGKISESTFKMLIPELEYILTVGVKVENLDVRSDGNKHYCELTLGGDKSILVWANLYFSQKQAVAEYAIYDELHDKSLNGKTHYTSISRTKSIREHHQSFDSGHTTHSAHFVEKICRDFPVFGEVISEDLSKEPLYEKFAETRDTRPLKRLMSKLNSEMQ